MQGDTARHYAGIGVTMKIVIGLIVTICAFSLSQVVHAGRNEFCAGFAEGYKTIKGNMVMVPMCPMAPMTPLGSTDFREGLKAGMEAAKN